MDAVRSLRLLTAFLAGFALTVMTVTAAWAYTPPPWMKTLLALPGLVARSLGG
jgi:uncharacterized protein (DUF983 family)